MELQYWYCYLTKQAGILYIPVWKVPAKTLERNIHDRYHNPNALGVQTLVGLQPSQGGDGAGLDFGREMHAPVLAAERGDHRLQDVGARIARSSRWICSP